MSAKANHFKIGLFVLLALAIGVVGVTVLGAGTLFRDEAIAETYIDESVQGLEVGAAVRFRGVRVGRVREIGFVRNAYPRKSGLDAQSRYVLVRFTLYPNTFRGALPKDLALILRREIYGRGLRCRLASVGVTGMLYLEVDYLDGDENPILEPDWSPEYYYIPSAPSTITRLSETIENLMDKLDQVLTKLEALSIEPVIRDLGVLIKSLTSQIDNAQLGEIGGEVRKLLVSLQESNKAFQELLRKPEIDQFLTEAVRTAQGAAQTVEKADALVERARGRVTELLDTLLAVSKRIGETAEKLDTLLAGEDLPEAAAYLKNGLRHLERLVVRQQQNLETIIENVRRITEDFKEVGRMARENPPQLLLGKPPKPSELGKEKDR